MTGEGSTLRTERLPHNHIFQISPKQRNFYAPDCVACQSIDLDRMRPQYAYYWAHSR